MSKLSITIERGKTMAEIKNGMRPIHPGEVLREEFLLPLGLTAQAVAEAIHVPAQRINEIAHERRAITADTALRLARYFGTSAEFWMGLQADYDLRKTEQAVGAMLDTIQGIAAHA
jgi:addiction module HigA family antidote